MSLIVGKIRKSIYGKAAPYQVGQYVYVPRTDPEMGWERVEIRAIRRDHVYVDGWWRSCDEVRAEPEEE